MLRKSFCDSTRAVSGVFHPAQGWSWVSVPTKAPPPGPSTEWLPQIPLSSPQTGWFGETQRSIVCPELCP